MQIEDHIVHQGFVTGVKNNVAHVQLFERTECHDCRIKEFCGVTDEDRSHFDVPQSNLRVGDEVVLDVKPSTGFKAMFWAYFFPFLLMLAILIIGQMAGIEDRWNGLMALIILIPYFFSLSRFKRLLKSQLHIEVTKL